MKKFNINEFAEKANQKFNNSFIVEANSNMWSNEIIYSLSRYLKSNNIWGFFKNKKKESFAFSANFNFDNQVVKLYVNNNSGTNRKIVERIFQLLLKDYMDKAPAFTFDEYTKSRHMSCMIWTDFDARAEKYLNHLIERERKADGGITNIKYNVNYGNEYLKRICEKSNVAIEDFRKIYFDYEFAVCPELER